MANISYDEEKSEKSFRLFILITLIFLIIVMMFIEGSLKWVLGLFIILFMGVFIIIEIYGKSAEISSWKRENELDKIVNLNLERISDIAGRAYKGQEVSKSLFEERMKKEFLKKVKNMRNISNAKMKEISDDEERLREIIDDDMITDFIIESKSYTDVISHGLFSKKTIKRLLGMEKISVDEEYKNKIKRILERMEEWN